MHCFVRGLRLLLVLQPLSATAFRTKRCFLTSEFGINLSAHQQFCRGTQRFGQADSVREIRELNSADKVAVVFSMNGFSPLDAPADRERFFSALDIWRSLGVRFMHLGYNNRNWFCDGCEEPTDGGLTNLGRELITSMEQIGIIPDFSHAGH